MTPHRFRERRWMLAPLTIFLVARAISGVMLAVGASRQAAIDDASGGYKVTVPTPESPGYLGVVTNWDGQWYRAIAEHGYPAALPQVDGEVVPNEWAFTPGYPLTVRAVMFLARIDFPLAATIVSLVCGATAMVVIYGMVRERLDDHAAKTLVLALCLFPSAPVFQVAYTESMALLFVALALKALTKRAYGWVVVWAALLSVTRPVLLPLAMLIALVWVLRWRRRHVEAFPQRERVVLAMVGFTCMAMVATWPVIAAVVVRDPGAFTDTMASWPINKALGGANVNWLTLTWEYPALLGLLVFPLIAVVVFTALRPGGRSWPTTWRWWAPIYVLYILIATKPSAGILRYMLLAMFPLAPLLRAKPGPSGTPDAVARAVCVIALVGMGLVGQYFWATEIFTIDRAPDRQILP
jgi:hypothetical protein